MYRILVVDDFAANAMVIKAQLAGADADYDVRIYNSGKQVVTQLESGMTADLVLLDINMPDMDGVQVLKRIRMIEALKKIPVIFVTGIADRNKVSEGFKYGVDDVIAKPTSATFLRERVRRALEGQTPLQVFKKNNDGMGRTSEYEISSLYLNVVDDYNETVLNANDRADSFGRRTEKVFGVEFPNILDCELW